ncbi:MAG: hypothetical protein ABJ059_00030, partial [Hyphomicrobiales bacterium]
MGDVQYRITRPEKGKTEKHAGQSSFNRRWFHLYVHWVIWDTGLLRSNFEVRVIIPFVGENLDLGLTLMMAAIS